MKQTKCKTILVLMFFSSLRNLSAKSYVFGSIGTQFDLGRLGKTITQDGQNAYSYYDVQSSDR
ncbi:hypothetical protein LEP1GSC050_4192 [Leptospira broomii serovar Hurstbridge str. 5399]|uniref:Uncharacterized protein n=1 Tax=Leptospira broomii serovar Hurstbridge str. 5399 TaxID=1049789 RepID=T0GCS8_9LEPT|nr:porin OmpL1 [Leptospira broomii]EQA44589.1 hypothetical protein LEP1GSC050_4192 [Leptospira broomii serovar Hurstbridge str. 5399]